MPIPGSNKGSGSPKDDSLRSRTTISNALTDQLPTLHDPRGSLSPLRAQEEQHHEVLASILGEAMSILAEAMSIIENEIDDDDSADDDDGNSGRGASSNSSNYGGRKQRETIRSSHGCVAR
jgi:hypothetical protein